MNIQNLNPFFKGPKGEVLCQVAEKFWENGFCCYIAGGAVRDFLIGREINDLDLVTDALPKDIIKLFPKNIQVGIQFGIVVIIYKGHHFEVATFRSDGEYIDGRHPENVIFSSAELDAQRRDFTINALFYDLKTNIIIDFVNGREDIKLRLIRAVGSPQLRFQQDHLRVLRALRFEAQLDFQIESETWNSIKQWATSIPKVSAERIKQELSKGINSGAPCLFVLHLKTSGVYDVLFDNFITEIKNEIKLINKEIIKTQFMNEVILNQIYFEGKLNDLKINLFSPADLLSFLVLSFYYNFFENLIKELYLAYHSSISQKMNIHFNWGLKFDKSFKNISNYFNLSKLESKKFKELLSVSWYVSQWPKFRLGYRLNFLNECQSNLMLNLLYYQLPDHKNEFEIAKVKPSLFLNGTDVENLPPLQRGSFLKELLYLQWEGSIKSKPEALELLKNVYSKYKEESFRSSH